MNGGLDWMMERVLFEAVYIEFRLLCTTIYVCFVIVCFSVLDLCYGHVYEMQKEEKLKNQLYKSKAHNFVFFLFRNKAKSLKVPFETQVLKLLGDACSHGEIWVELHPSDDQSQASSQVSIEANLKQKGRAREKATMDYNGDIACVVYFFILSSSSSILFCIHVVLYRMLFCKDACLPSIFHYSNFPSHVL